MNKTAAILQDSFIWLSNTKCQQEWGAFRHIFCLKNIPKEATLNIFADSRYMLWVNGEYVQRGPARFDSSYPRYDVIDIKDFLNNGDNLIAVIVHSYIGGANGRIMEHIPGMAACLCLDNSEVIRTNEEWLSNNNTIYKPVNHSWGTIPEFIDTRNSDIGWENIEYDDSHWSRSRKLIGKQWGKLKPRNYPLLVENKLDFNYFNQLKSTSSFLNGGEYITIDLNKIATAYPLIKFKIEEDQTWINLEFNQFHKNGKFERRHAPDTFIISNKQSFTYRASETQAFRYLTISVHSGKVKLSKVNVIERSYPYTLQADFKCSELFFNKVWKASVQTVKCCSQDAYTDDAIREKAEWLADAVVCCHPISRITFSNTSKNIPDSQLFKQCLLRIGQSQSEEGRLKAHHPSDRYDIHAYIDDYNFLWINGLKRYYVETGDIKFLRDQWCRLVKIINYYYDRIDDDGLLSGTEFCYVCNPVAYKLGKGTTLNIGFLSALLDSAKIANKLGKNEYYIKYSKAATSLRSKINELLLDVKRNTYSGGIFENKIEPPTLHAAIYALYNGIVPISKVDRVREWLFNNLDNYSMWPYIYFFLFKVIYDINTFEADKKVLEIIEDKWSSIIEMGGDSVSENFNPLNNNDSIVHQMGAAPALYFSKMVLGIRERETLQGLQLIFNPRPADLKFAEGKVLCPTGICNVKWENDTNKKLFLVELTTPDNCEITVILPVYLSKHKVIINKKKLSEKELQQAVSIKGLLIINKNINFAKNNGVLNV